jgi:hypothetical protein
MLLLPPLDLNDFCRSRIQLSFFQCVQWTERSCSTPGPSDTGPLPTCPPQYGPTYSSTLLKKECCNFCLSETGLAKRPPLRQQLHKGRAAPGSQTAMRCPLPLRQVGWVLDLLALPSPAHYFRRETLRSAVQRLLGCVEAAGVCRGLL